jgi:hypothetical protein
LREVHLPEFHLPDSVTNFEFPKFERPSVDVGKAVSDAKSAMSDAKSAMSDAASAVSDAASNVHIGRPKRQSRLPFAVVGLVAAGLIGWIVLSQETIRARLAAGSRALRVQVAAVREGIARSQAHHDDADAVAFTASETAPMVTSPLDDTPGYESDYPSGLGSNNGDEDLPLKKTKVRA